MLSVRLERLMRKVSGVGLGGRQMIAVLRNEMVDEVEDEAYTVGHYRIG